MQTKLNKGTFIRPMIVVLCLFSMNISPMAQITGSAKIQAAIVSPDEISGMALSSADGMQFMLQNGCNSCFDITIDGLPLLPEDNKVNQKVSYQVSIDKRQSGLFDITNIRLNVLLNGEVKSGTYLAEVPYTISVNYN